MSGHDSQPRPIVHDGPLVKDQLIIDIQALCARRAVKYGTHLQPHNGRDSLLDAYEEVLDLALYLKAVLMERSTEPRNQIIAGMDRDLGRMIQENRDLADQQHALLLQVHRLESDNEELRGLLEAEGIWHSDDDGDEPKTELAPICIGCNKHPDDLSEYSPEITGTDLTPVEYVRQEEGTFNRLNGHFLCTICYIAAGTPASPRGWIAD